MSDSGTPNDKNEHEPGKSVGDLSDGDKVFEGLAVAMSHKKPYVSGIG